MRLPRLVAAALAAALAAVPVAFPVAAHAEPDSRPATTSRAQDGATQPRPETAEGADREAEDGGTDDGATATRAYGPFRIAVPAAWKAQELPHAGVRKGDFELPAPREGLAPGVFRIFYFGPSSGGSVEANLTRWQRQFAAPDGGEAETQVTKKDLDGMALTILELRGDYLGSGLPGAPSTVEKDSMMLAAVLETDQGSYFFKTTGPRETLEHWRNAWFKMVLGIEATGENEE